MTYREPPTEPAPRLCRCGCGTVLTGRKISWASTQHKTDHTNRLMREKMGCVPKTRRSPNAPEEPTRSRYKRIDGERVRMPSEQYQEFLAKMKDPNRKEYK